jgi:hypothetical protein
MNVVVGKSIAVVERAGKRIKRVDGIIRSYKKQKTYGSTGFFFIEKKTKKKNKTKTKQKV